MGYSEDYEKSYIPTREEVEVLRAAEQAEPKVRKPIVSKNNGNHSHARTANGRIVYSPESKTQNVVIGKTVFPWSEKAVCGWVLSGKSIAGGIECDKEGKKIKCHECGGWFVDVSAHARRSHKLTGREYRMLHDLPMSQALRSPTLRKFNGVSGRKNASRRASLGHVPPLSDPKKRETIIGASIISRVELAKTGRRRQAQANIRLSCKTQLTNRILAMAAILGHCPTDGEMRMGDKWGPIHSSAITAAFEMPARKALESIGLKPAPKGGWHLPTIPLEIREAVPVMYSQGFSYTEICKRLGISQPTARHYNFI